MYKYTSNCGTTRSIEIMVFESISSFVESFIVVKMYSGIRIRNVLLVT